MSSISNARSLSKLITIGVLSILFVNSPNIPALSNTNNTKTNTNEDSDLGRPTDMTEGIGRGSGTEDSNRSCLNQLIALVPVKDGAQLHEGENCNSPNSSITEAALAYTSISMSNVWVYIPEAYTDRNMSAELALIDNRREIERWNVPLPSSAGVICVPIPYTLESDNAYRWRFQVSTNSGSTRASENPQVSGLIVYSTQADTYWYDDVARLDAIQQNDGGAVNPSSAGNTEEWRQLLNENGLGAIASAPIASGCSGHFQAETPEP